MYFIIDIRNSSFFIKQYSTVGDPLKNSFERVFLTFFFPHSAPYAVRPLGEVNGPLQRANPVLFEAVRPSLALTLHCVPRFSEQALRRVKKFM